MSGKTLSYTLVLKARVVNQVAVRRALHYTALRMRTQLAVCAGWVLAACAAQAQWTPIAHPAPVTAREFPIMAWDLSPSDSTYLNWMKDAGFNMSGFCRVEDLDKVRAAGLSCLVIDKRFETMDWEKAPGDAVLDEIAADLKRQAGSHPAVAGFFLRDEPSASFMPGLGRAAAALRRAMPDKWAYVNLFPTYANSRQLGTATYEEHLRTYLKEFRPQFISWDNYSLLDGEMQDRFYTNLEIIRRVAQEAGLPFWNCILGNAHYMYMEPSDATLSLQVYSTLAYGGRGIQYFTFFAIDSSNYRLGAVDQFGNRTPTWEMLRRINLQIHALAPTMLQLRSTGVYHSPAVPEQGKSLSESRLVKSVPGAGQILIGEFEDNRGRAYLMAVNRDLKRPVMLPIQLRRENASLVRISPYSGKETGKVTEPVGLAPGGGGLFRVE